MAINVLAFLWSMLVLSYLGVIIVGVMRARAWKTRPAELLPRSLWVRLPGAAGEWSSLGTSEEAPDTVSSGPRLDEASLEGVGEEGSVGLARGARLNVVSFPGARRSPAGAALTQSSGPATQRYTFEVPADAKVWLRGLVRKGVGEEPATVVEPVGGLLPAVDLSPARLAERTVTRYVPWALVLLAVPGAVISLLLARLGVFEDAADVPAGLLLLAGVCLITDATLWPPSTRG